MDPERGTKCTNVRKLCEIGIVVAVIDKYSLKHPHISCQMLEIGIVIAVIEKYSLKHPHTSCQMLWNMCCCCCN